MRTAAEIPSAPNSSVPQRGALSRRWLSVSAAPRALAMVFGYGALLLLYIPIVWLIIMSISEQPLTGIPGPFTLRWYEQLLDGQGFSVGEPLLLSLMIAVFVAMACMTTATLVGRTLTRSRKRGWLLLGYILPLMIPGIVAGAGLFMYYRVIIGVKMGVWSLMLAHFVWSFPFALLAMLVISSRLDERLLDAASDLGANGWKVFWHIEAPLLKPGIFMAGFFSFLLSFNELPYSIFMRAGQMTLPLYLWIQSTAHSTSIPLVYAMSALMTIGSIALTFIAIRGAFHSMTKS